MPQTIALIHDALFPVRDYGGTERVVWWLSKGLAERGVRVTLVCRPGSTSPFANIVPHDFSKPFTSLAGADLLHFFYNPPGEIKLPYVATIGGNGKPNESFPRNTIFVSQNHAARHGAQAFVHNGIDPDEYQFKATKSSALLFLAKASWKVKNVRGAIRIARKSGKSLNVVGGKRWYRTWRGIHWRGMLGGESKRHFLAEALGLLFPVLWDEPFGLAVVEAMVSGTPVLATPFGSLPELISPETGRLCASEAEFLAAVPQLGDFSASACRDRALAHFHYRVMTDAYLRCYEKALGGEFLNARPPQIQGSSAKLLK